MSRGNSKSTSKTKTVTTQTTQQRDERVAATDAAVAVGANNSGTIHIQTVPDGLGDAAQAFIGALVQAQDAAIGAAQEAMEIAAGREEDKKEMIVMGLAALAVIALIVKL